MAKIVGLSASCAGRPDKESLLAAVQSQQSLVGSDGLASFTEAGWNSLRERVPTEFADTHCTLLGFSPMAAAIAEAGWSAQELRDAGFIFSSTTSQIDQWEDRLPHYQALQQNTNDIRRGTQNQSLGTPAIRLSKFFGIDGPRTLITSSCSASLQGLALALYWLRSGKVQRCIVGATEIHSTLTRVGFGSLRLLSTEVCRPFAKNRGGINLGEGAAFLCLESSNLRKESPWGYLSGAGLGSDAFHATSPHPEGLGSFNTMNMAIADAGLTPQDIDWVYAHGTGSPANDLAEARAIKKIFTEDAPFVTSTKSIHGHTLAASGAVESVLGLLAMKRQCILPTASEFDADSLIDLRIPLQVQEHKIRHFIKNSLGFGGINASLVFSSSEER